MNIIDYTINLGNILTLIGMLAGIWVMKRTEHKDNLKRLEAIEKQLEQMQEPYKLLWAWFKKEHNITDKDI